MENDRLFELLNTLEERDLDVLWMTHLERDSNDHEFLKQSKEEKVPRISAEVRRIAGNSLRNIPRKDHDYAWRDILMQIAEKIDARRAHDDDEKTLEDSLCERLFKDAQSLKKENGTENEIAADKAALEALTSKARRRAYLDTTAPAYVLALGLLAAAVRPLIGPNYKRLVPAVFYILAAAHIKELMKAAEVAS